MQQQDAYPVRFTVDYPDRRLDRVATVVALGTWAVVRLLRVELTVGKGPDPSQVGAVEVATATVLAGLAAWAVHRVLARSARTARWWPFVATTAIAVSIIGPSYLADGAEPSGPRPDDG